MRLTGALSRTSKFFGSKYLFPQCSPSPCHDNFILHHLLFQKHHRDWKDFYDQDRNFGYLQGFDELEKTKLRLVRLLGKQEVFYQKNLEKLFGLSHERLSNDWITDLSNRHVLIEIKNVKNLRSSIGQIQQYAVYRPEAVKVICLFGCPPPAQAMQANVEICERMDITLVWLWSEQIYLWMKEETIL